MKQTRITEEQTQFYCPITKELILDLEAEEFSPSEALVFCYVESDDSYMDGSEWAEKQQGLCLKEIDVDEELNPNLEAFKCMLNKEYPEYPELICYIVDVYSGGHLNPVDTLYFGIDMGVKNKL